MSSRALSLSVLMLFGLFATRGEAGFIGRTFDAVYFFPDDSSPYPFGSFTPSSFVVGAGIETIGNVEDVTSLPVDFTDKTLTIGLDTVLIDPVWTATSFNGILFSLQSAGPLGIIGASVDPSTTLAGFDASRVTFDSGKIGINWNGLAYQDGQQVVINFAFVPEPSSLALVGVSGLAGLAWIGRERIRAAGRGA